MAAPNVDRWSEKDRLNISRYLLSRYEDDSIERVVTQDDTWVNHFYRESKMQSKQWKHPGSPTRWFIQQRRWWPQSFGKVKRWSWLMLIFWARMHIMQTNWGGYARKSQERCEENWLAVFCSFRTTSLPTHHKLPWMLRQNVDLKSFLIPHIFLVWLLISICAQKMKSHLRGTQYGSNEGIIEAVNKYLGTRKRPYILKG